MSTDALINFNTKSTAGTENEDARKDEVGACGDVSEDMYAETVEVDPDIAATGDEVEFEGGATADVRS